MKTLYIGQCEEGSTSRMRYEIMSEILNQQIDLVNITPLIASVWKPFRSIGWRYKVGPLIKKINQSILQKVKQEKNYDLIWIDKGVFISPGTLDYLRQRAKTLVHFTPDPAFLFHQSNLFEAGLGLYDFCVTTKSFELDIYKEKGAKEVIYCTQGYDENIHKPLVDFQAKLYDVCFIGHFERERSEIIQELINSGVSVALAGIKWRRFASRNKGNGNLFYFGHHISGLNYSKLIGESKIGLGLLSKWIPEKHTTRTFEIPACGTALLTEENQETRSFFSEDSVLFYQNKKDILGVVKRALSNMTELQKRSLNGMNQTKSGGFSYAAIMRELLKKMDLK